MIHRFVSHNGNLLPVEDVRLSPGQGGLLSGWGLFTTIRVTERIPFAFERHWQRLSRDSEITHCPMPVAQVKVREWLEQVLRANDVREGCARLYVVANQTGFWRSDEKFVEADIVICSANLPVHRDGVNLTLREQGRHAASPLAGVKVTSWLNNAWSLYEAQQAGYDEVILLNERGEVAELTAANIFCVRDGLVFTPPLSSGCLPGVTRSVLLDIARPAGVSLEEKTLFPEDLYAADEVLITSTNRNVVSVASIAGRKIRTVSGPFMHKLDAAFARYVREYIGAHASVGGRR
jgi:branched-chain amino acid aminotransferase